MNGLMRFAAMAAVLAAAPAVAQDTAVADVVEEAVEALEIDLTESDREYLEESYEPIRVDW